MYGKIFEQMYEGSMVGAGTTVFAVMGYIIAKHKPDFTHGAVVELNPKLLAYILGGDESDIRQAIEKLCSPDPESRSKEEEGRRLVQVGQFSYKVVNGAKYRAIRNEVARREQNREAQRRFRAKKVPRGTNTSEPGESAYVKAFENGATDNQLQSIIDESLPLPKPEDE